jgi:hypothetical protein
MLKKGNKKLQHLARGLSWRNLLVILLLSMIFSLSVLIYLGHLLDDATMADINSELDREEIKLLFEDLHTFMKES